MQPAIDVTAAGVTVTRDLVMPIDVLFDGERVWSFNPARDARQQDDGSLVVPWPQALVPHLSGSTEATLRTHTDEEVVFHREISLGEDGGRISIRDDLGNPLAVDKGGRMQRTFSRTDDSAREHIMDAVEKILHDLREECHLDGYLAYGCLLGAVRTGHMIGHDSDADLSYLSKYDHPFDIIRESRAASARMRSLGWRVVRMSGADFKVWVPLPGGRRCGVDVFGSFYIGDKFHIMGSKRGDLDPSAILPLGTVTLEGREIAAPADPEAFLAYTYGPTWRVPDPAFKFMHPRANVHRMSAWWRGQRRRLRHWQEFYASARAKRVPTEPSPFARWVAERVEVDSKIVDVGAGNGRDAVWFAAGGHPVTALDYVGKARKLTGRLAQKKQVSVMVADVNLYDLRSTLLAGAVLAHQPGVRHIYARGILDAVDDFGRESLWQLASMCQRRDGLTFLEFRTAQSQQRKRSRRRKITGLGADAVEQEIIDRGGTVVHRETGGDRAPLADEDPSICRLIVRWNQ